MTSRSRLLVLLISTPLIVLVVVGGVLGRSMAPQDSYAPLKTFDEVVNLIVSNYVEPVEPDSIMHGAMRGLAEGLDADSAWLSTEEMAAANKRGAEPKGTVGIELTRQYYLRDRSRAMDRPPRRPASGPATSSARSTTSRRVRCRLGRRAARRRAWIEGEAHRASRQRQPRRTCGAVREERGGARGDGQDRKPGVGLLRIASFTDRTADGLKQAVATLKKDGAARW